MAKLNDRRYLDFYLQLRDLDQVSGSFKVAVLPSPSVGETREAVTVQYNLDELAPYLKKLEHRSIDQESLSRFGELLAAMLLPIGEIRELFEQALSQTGLDGGLRLRLLTNEPKLAQLPWEYTYLPIYTEGGKDYRHFLTLNPQISLVRHEPIPRQHPQVEGSSPDKLNLLVAMANPQGDLNLATEQQNLKQVLEGFNVDGVTFEWQPMLDEATVQNLTAALMKKPELFYFAGHGLFDQEGYIQLNGRANSAPDLMPATQLALKLKQAGVRVAVFGTCDSARQDGISEWMGVAPTLVAEGVPVVVAMQYPVVDVHAISFSEAFYSALAAGLSVDEAVSFGRLAMLGIDSNGKDRHIAFKSDQKSDLPPTNVQWGVPVLYMRSADSVIFARKTSVMAEQIRKVITQNIESIQDGSDFTGVVINRDASGFIDITNNFKVIKNSKVIGVVIN
jgi:hypothetical protein